MSGATERAPDFTLARYAQLLEIAGECGYRFVRFSELGDEAGGNARGNEGNGDVARAIALRHDIDYDPAFVAAVSAIEREAGVVATYCFQPDSLTYSIDGAPAREAVETIIRDGHDLGLHVDITAVADADVHGVVTREDDAMAARFGVRPAAVSWHMAGRRHAGHLEFEDLVNTYAPRFFGEIGYVSDSNQSWRGRDLGAILRAGEHDRLQILTHPIWWRAQPVGLLDAMTDLAASTGVALDALLTPEQRELLACPREQRI